MKLFTTLLLSTVLAAPAFAAPAPANDGLPNKGKVVSTIDAGQYTYIEVAQENNKKTLWLAAPAVSLKKNATVRFEDGAEMTNFRSATLNRTFPSIRFISRVVADKK